MSYTPKSAAVGAVAASCWMCFAAAISTRNGTAYFMGVDISQPLPSEDQSISFPELFPVGNISAVQDLFALSTGEIAGLKSDFVTFLRVMQDDLGISVEASVESGLDQSTSVYVGPAPSGHNASVPFTASLFSNTDDNSSVPNAILAPFIRDPTKITSTNYAVTGNSTLDSDTYSLIEGGYVLYPLEDLQLSLAVGLIPKYSIINASILQWVGKVTQATFRIKSSRKIPIPVGSSICFNAAGYPGSQYVPLGTGEVQAAWSQVPAPGGQGYVLTWTTTGAFPAFPGF